MSNFTSKAGICLTSSEGQGQMEEEKSRFLTRMVRRVEDPSRFMAHVLCLHIAWGVANGELCWRD